jgi:uncharacterized BrkB/YihY/UPF0761 family membrane protein
MNSWLAFGIFWLLWVASLFLAALGGAASGVAEATRNSNPPLSKEAKGKARICYIAIVLLMLVAIASLVIGGWHFKGV